MEDIMKAKTKRAVKSAAGTVVIAAVAAGLVLTTVQFRGTGRAVQLESQDETAGYALDETAESLDELMLTAGRKSIGSSFTMLGQSTGETDQTDGKEEVAGSGDVEVVKVRIGSVSTSSAKKTPLDQYFSDRAIVNPDRVDQYLNIRSEAESTGDDSIVGIAQLDQVLQVLSRKDGWSQVVCGDVTGWVDSSYLLTGSAAADYIEANADAYAEVSVPSMNIRLNKSTTSDILMTAVQGEAFPLVSMEDGWAYVKLGDILCGYMAGNCVTINYVWNDLILATEVAGAAADEVVDMTQAANRTPVVDPLAVIGQTTEAAAEETQPVSSEQAAGSSSADAPAASEGQAPEETQPSAEESGAADPVPTVPAETEPAVTDPALTAPAATDPAPTEPAPTEPVPTEPETPAQATITGIEAFYNGSTQKTEGEVVGRSEVMLYVYYSDGSIRIETDGWTSDDIGMLLHAGQEVITISYAGFSSNIVLEVLPAATEPVPTEPAPTEPAPTEPIQPAPTEPAPTEPIQPAPTEPVPTEPTQPAPTEPAPTEPVPTEPVPTEPAPTEPADQPQEAYVPNVALSGQLTYYTLSLCSQYGVDSSIIFSVMYQESKFNPSAVSGSGAIGLMQIIPRFSQARMSKLGVADLYDARSNILVGVDMLAEYYYAEGSWIGALTRYRYGTSSGSTDYAAMILSRAGMFQ